MSGSESDTSCQLYEPFADFSEDEAPQADLSHKEGHFTEVPREPRAVTAKSKPRLSLKSRKKMMSDKIDGESPSSDGDLMNRESSGSFRASPNRPNDVLYPLQDLIQV